MRVGVLLLCCTLVGCAEVVREVRDQIGFPEEDRQETASVRRGLKPMPVRPLNVSSQCRVKDEVGVQTRLDLQVQNAVVRQFSAEVRIPRQGTCRFDLKEFQQVATLPNVKLTSRKRPGCQVNMWEQGEQVTVAFSDCASSCEGDAFSYLWPILVESRNGECI